MGFATSMDPDQPAHPRSLVRIHAIRFKTLWGLTKLLANSMDPDQTARMRRLFWIHSGRKAHYVGFATVLLKCFWKYNTHLPVRSFTCYATYTDLIYV